MREPEDITDDVDDLHDPAGRGRGVAASTTGISVFTMLAILMRRRRLIGTLMVVAASIALAVALLLPRQYVATAAFLPQGGESSRSSLAGLAGQLGILSQPTSQGPFYIELLHSRELLEPIASTPLSVPELRGGRRTLYQLHPPRGQTDGQRRAAMVEWLQKIVSATESRTGVVTVSVATEWPSVSKAVADLLLTRLNDFNLRTRQSQAAEERRFTGERLEATRASLRVAEDRLKDFLQHNRQYTLSPELSFERDRLMRETTLYQQLLASLSQSYEEARSREVRDTPVLTVIEPPELPASPRPTWWWLKAFIGLVLGFLVGAFISVLSYAVQRRRSAGDPDAEEFARMFTLRRRAAPAGTAGLRRDAR